MSNNTDVIARVQQLEAQGAGRNEGWESMIASDNTNGQSLQTQELKQSKELLGSVYTDRNGVQHNVDADGNPVDTNTAVQQDGVSEDRTEASYVLMNDITNKELTQANAAKAYASGNAKDMTHAIHEELLANFAPQMDAYKSSPKAVWQDVQKFAKASRTNNERKVFNEVMAGGTGQERQEAISDLIQSFKQSL